MPHFARLLSKNISRFWSEEKLFSSKAPMFLPFYHLVSNNPLAYIQNYHVINQKEFENHLDYFLRFFKPVSLDFIYKNPQSKEKVFHLSFDDGLSQCSDIIAPLLKKKGIPATFFINSGFVDNKELFHRYKASLILSELEIHPDSETEGFLRKNDINRENLLQAPFQKRDILDEAADMLRIDMGAFLQKQQPYMSTQQIQNLSDSGFTIGGHSHKHPEFWKISEKKQLKHVRKSMNWINENVPQKIKAFAFPYTDDGISLGFIKGLKDQNICDITFGTAGVKYDELVSHYQRYPVEESGDFRQNMRTEFTYFKIREMLGKAEVKHKK